MLHSVFAAAHPVVGNSDSFVLIEKWASKEALDAHDLAPHMLEAAKHNPTFRAGPATVLFLESVVLSSH
ncbi:antibiotic biosynthesis monooxygenase [Pseudomonas sp.]|uniref:putative quinol monooxygenase n=1 Tax=Pseudomonas sp. TaxID=306 RepID=UPI0025826145|nr:antibiotic biosynthesis monooxygenase [Pseudomonas sp.]